MAFSALRSGYGTTDLLNSRKEAKVLTFWGGKQTGRTAISLLGLLCLLTDGLRARTRSLKLSAINVMSIVRVCPSTESMLGVGYEAAGFLS